MMGGPDYRDMPDTDNDEKGFTWSERLAEYKTHQWAEERCIQIKPIFVSC